MIIYCVLGLTRTKIYERGLRGVTCRGKAFYTILAMLTGLGYWVLVFHESTVPNCAIYFISCFQLKHVSPHKIAEPVKIVGGFGVSLGLPFCELTCPTYGKGNSSSQPPGEGDTLHSCRISTLNDIVLGCMALPIGSKATNRWVNACVPYYDSR